MLSYERVLFKLSHISQHMTWRERGCCVAALWQQEARVGKKIIGAAILFFSRHTHISHKVPHGKHKIKGLPFQKKIQWPKCNENPSSWTLGTTILLPLYNFLIAEDK